MNKIILICLFGLMSLLYPNEKYVVTELGDGSYTFTGKYDIVYNEGSSLKVRLPYRYLGKSPAKTRIRQKTNFIKIVSHRG